jgi:tRNA threonylcarbamoyl adenosine modification protein (Sua5/YciO/YrdC/YwlC family)
MILAVHPQHPEPRKIARAVDVLGSGGLIAYPTDTVYAIGCVLDAKKAIERLRALKGTGDRPLTLLCPDLSEIARYAVLDNQAYRLMRRLCPGPYCFVLSATRELPKMLVSRQRTVGVRVPAHAVVAAITRGLGRPLLSTSAGRHGAEACTHAREIDDRFPGLELILDGGWGGLQPSTVLDLSRGAVDVLREGAGPIDTL